MARRWPILLSAVAALAAGCGAGTPGQGRLIDSVPIACAVGEPPGYFVPHPPDSPPALLGCARLGVSGKRVELSGNPERIGGTRHVCINPAYTGRGQDGLFIPAACVRPPLARLAMLGAGQPRQGVRGYAYVVWGTARASTSEVVARFEAGTARAAVFTVAPELARTLGEPPFGLFVLELPLAAACAPVTVLARDEAAERIPRRARLCRRS